MEITVKDAIYVAAIVLLITINGIQPDDIDSWNYCEVENNLKKCESLSRYGVEDAKCKYINEDGELKSDICTSQGIRYPWKPLRDYVDINTSSETQTYVTAIQECNTSFHNVSVPVWGVCTGQKFNYSDCKRYWPNGSCHDWSVYNYTYGCQLGSYEKTENVTICEKKGYLINHSNGIDYEIPYACCQYYNVSPYTEFTGYPIISCKQEINNICNPLIQQTSRDQSVYDEAGRIFVITREGIRPKLVGGYEWFNDNDPYIGRVEEVNKRKISEIAR